MYRNKVAFVFYYTSAKIQRTKKVYTRPVSILKCEIEIKKNKKKVTDVFALQKVYAAIDPPKIKYNNSTMSVCV